MSAVTELQTKLSSVNNTKADKATTLSGYGITDGVEIAIGYENDIDTYTITSDDDGRKGKLYKIVGMSQGDDDSSWMEYFVLTVPYESATGGRYFTAQYRIRENNIAKRRYINGGWETWRSFAVYESSIAGYNIKDAYTKTEIDTKLSKKADKGTTLESYGITDGVNIHEINESELDTSMPWGSYRQAWLYRVAPTQTSGLPLSGRCYYVLSVPIDNSTGTEYCVQYRIKDAEISKRTYDTTTSSWSDWEEFLNDKANSDLSNVDNSTFKEKCKTSGYLTGSGTNSHNLGDFYSEANGKDSFSQGQGTIANGEAQAVFGRCNIPDTKNKYAVIVGNGIEYTNGDEFVPDESNAYTLDWNGNAHFAGDIYTNSVEIPLARVMSLKIPTITLAALSTKDYHVPNYAITPSDHIMIRIRDGGTAGLTSLPGTPYYRYSTTNYSIEFQTNGTIHVANLTSSSVTISNLEFLVIERNSLELVDNSTQEVVTT